MQPDQLTVCLYVAKLAETCSYRTIKKYVNGIRILHLEAGLMNPLPAMFNLERTLRGIKRVKGDVQPNRFHHPPKRTLRTSLPCSGRGWVGKANFC
jgi:hypothetical protein